ncbi:MAG: spore germination protein [Clostridium sp.]|nr:spore germination protein [Clostridium sp.]MCM1444513.1 spore germination protein [Candidatus Amulumruptor caecigallinarius]
MKKINSLQLGCMITLIIASATIGKGMYAVINIAGVDSWISVLIAGILGVVVLLMYLYIGNYEPDLPLPEKNKKLFGNVIGTIINYLLCIAIFILLVSLFYDLTNFIASQFLSQTPIFVIGFLFILIIIYINIKGIDVISRVSLILIVICTALFLIEVFGLLFNMDFSNLMPVMEFGIGKPLHGSLYIIMLNIVPIIILLIVPKNNLVDYKKYKIVTILFYIFSILVIFLTILLTIGNLGIDLARVYLYPEYIVLKRISIFNFVDRIENLIVLQWIFSLFINISLCTYFISNTINKRNNKVIIFLIAVLLLFVSTFIFKNNTIYSEYIINTSLYVKYFILFIIILIVGAIKLKRIKSKNKKI